MITRVASAVAGISAVTAIVAIPPTAQAEPIGSRASAATSCYAVADVPWYRSPSVYATGHIYCDPWADAEIVVKITANGATKGTTSAAYAAPDISDTAVAQNWSGNQTWCTVVSGTYYVNGGAYDVHDKSCETAGF
ncbi:hypothetical protein [Streptomyces sp. NBC_01190]|uniref:hypothetical protein n=1 Tax=Streptomyces sp. NBC_01190 TaxID=2903767 RepID=UPI0038632FE8|nr:hypothetical protein OG519_33845 [Streptomyces sp. NBC_01190]